MPTLNFQDAIRCEDQQLEAILAKLDSKYEELENSVAVRNIAQEEQTRTNQQQIAVEEATHSRMVEDIHNLKLALQQAIRNLNDD